MTLATHLLLSVSVLTQTHSCNTVRQVGSSERSGHTNTLFNWFLFQSPLSDTINYGLLSWTRDHTLHLLSHNSVLWAYHHYSCIRTRTYTHRYPLPSYLVTNPLRSSATDDFITRWLMSLIEFLPTGKVGLLIPRSKWWYLLDWDTTPKVSNRGLILVNTAIYYYHIYNNGWRTLPNPQMHKKDKWCRIWSGDAR